MDNINHEDYNVRYKNIKNEVNAVLSLQARILRQKRNLTQKQLAKLIGMKQARISLLEGHTRDPGIKIDTLARLAAVFGVGIRYEIEKN